MNSSIARTALEKKLQGITGSWERIPLLLQLAETVDKTDPQYSHQCAAEALALAEQLNDRFWIASGMQRLGLCIAHTYRHSETLHYLQSASRIFAQINEPRMKAKTDYAIARTFNTMGEFHKAAPLLEDSMRVFRSANDSEWIALTLLELGDVWQGVGEHGKGLLFYRRALRRAIKMERTSMTAGCYQAIALAYRMLGNMKGCRVYLHKCAVAYRAGNNRTGLVIGTTNLSSFYNDIRRFRQAEKYALYTLKLARELGHTTFEATAWCKLVSIYRSKEEYDKAARAFRRGIALARTSEASVIEGKLYEAYGSLCFELGKRKKGIACMKKALDVISASGHYPFYVSQVHESLAQHYEQIGNTEKALEHHKEFVRIREEFVNGQKVFEAGRAEMKHALRILERRLKKERADRSGLQETIERKESELRLLTLKMVRNEEQTRRKRFGTGHKNEVAVKAGKAPHNGLSGNWEVFAQQFNKVHYDFYTNLLRYYPTLTPAEIKVCSLIRVGLTSKEIAEILCISKKTVDKHRVRVHKKMALKTGASLSGFIAHL